MKGSEAGHAPQGTPTFAQPGCTWIQVPKLAELSLVDDQRISVTRVRWCGAEDPRIRLGPEFEPDSLFALFYVSDLIVVGKATGAGWVEGHYEVSSPSQVRPIDARRVSVRHAERRLLRGGIAKKVPPDLMSRWLRNELDHRRPEPSLTGIIPRLQEWLIDAQGCCDTFALDRIPKDSLRGLRGRAKVLVEELFVHLADFASDLEPNHRRGDPLDCLPFADPIRLLPRAPFRWAPRQTNGTPKEIVIETALKLILYGRETCPKMPEERGGLVAVAGGASPERVARAIDTVRGGLAVLDGIRVGRTGQASTPPPEHSTLPAGTAGNHLQVVGAVASVLVGDKLSPAPPASSEAPVAITPRAPAPSAPPAGASEASATNVVEKNQRKPRYRRVKDAVWEAYVLRRAGKTQVDIADILARKYGTTSQATVSRYLKRADELLGASYQMPEKFSKKLLQVIDPTQIETGRRIDGRTKRQREKQSEDDEK